VVRKPPRIVCHSSAWKQIDRQREPRRSLRHHHGPTEGEFVFPTPEQARYPVIWRRLASVEAVGQPLAERFHR
jgi:hypothetical protein